MSPERAGARRGAVRSASRRIRPGRIIGWACLVALMLVTLFPFYWMLRTALSTNSGITTEPTSLLPVDLNIDAFLRVLGFTDQAASLAQGGSGSSLDFWLYLRNSVVMASAITVFQVFFCAMAAYAFARLRWRGRDLLFFAMISAMLIPPIFTLLPNYVTMRTLGLDQTLIGLILPYAFMTPFAIFFLRQFFLGVSREMEEAAALDGLGRGRTFFRIIVPLSWAPISTLAILTYIGAWNEYLWPLLIANSPDTRVLTVALGVFKSQTPTGSPDWAGLMAATLVSAVPLIVLFALLGRRIVDSIGFSGLK